MQSGNGINKGALPPSLNALFLTWILPVLLFVVITAAVFPFQIDDSYISLRYAHNLAHGHGFVFNPGGERIEGYTNFLLVVIEAIMIRIGLIGLPPVKVLLIGFGVSLLTVMSWFGNWRLRRAFAGAGQETSTPESHWMIVTTASLLVAKAVRSCCGA